MPVPFAPGLPATPAALTLRLLDRSGQPAADALRLTELTLPGSPARALTPAQLRADALPPGEPFTFRSTLSFALPDSTGAPTLLAPDGSSYAPVRFWPRAGGAVVLYLVGAGWPSGAYHLSTAGDLTVDVANRPRQFSAPPIEHALAANFAGQLTLLGYDLPRRRVQAGDSFPLTLYWRAEGAIDRDLTVFNHLLDRANVQRGGADRIPQNYYSTLLWAPGEIVPDRYEVPVDPDAPPGVYWLDVGLYPSGQPGHSLPRFVEGRPVDSTGVRLGPIKVGGPPPGLTVIEARPETALNRTFGGQITLLGFSLGRENGRPFPAPIPAGSVESLELLLYWQAETTPQADYTVFVHLLDETGAIAAQADGPPAGGGYPASLWDAGEIVVDARSLTLSGELPPGQYTLQAGLYRPDTGQRLPLPSASDGAVRLTTLEVGNR